MDISAALLKPARLQRSLSCSSSASTAITLLPCNRQSLCDGSSHREDSSRSSSVVFTVKLGFEVKRVYESEDAGSSDNQRESETERVPDDDTDTDSDSRPVTPHGRSQAATTDQVTSATASNETRPRRGRLLLPRRRNSADSAPTGGGVLSLLTRQQYSRSDADRHAPPAMLQPPPSKLSAAQKRGCFQYIKRRHSTAVAFASADSHHHYNNNNSEVDGDLGDASHWEFVKVKHGVEMFKSRRSRCEVRGVTRVNGSVKSVMSLLAAGENTESFLHTQQILMGRDQVLEARVLAACVPSSASRFFHCGLKYMAMKNPFGMNPLDLVFLDYTDVTTSGDSNKLLGFRVIESIRVPEFRCASAKYTRASLRCEVYLVRETDVTGVVEVTFAAHLDPKSKYAAAKRSTWLDQVSVRLRNLRSYAEQAGFASRLRVEATPLVPSARCFLCETSFSLLRQRHHCRLCGHAACRRCCRKLPVFIGADTMKVRVCVGCRLHSRQFPDELGRVELERSRRDSIGNATWIAYDEIEDCEEEDGED